MVGAGIGDPELITLKGVKALQSADVVLYDALANEALLQHTPPTTALVYVGKRRGAKAYTQDEINERIVAYAHCCGHVVRLKGGDPFVFGRGHEELQFAQEHGLQTAYVPGISSTLAAAAAAGRVRALVFGIGEPRDEQFLNRYRPLLQVNAALASAHGELKRLLDVFPAETRKRLPA